MIKLKHIREIGINIQGNDYSGTQAPLVSPNNEVWCTTRDKDNRSHPLQIGCFLSRPEDGFFVTGSILDLIQKPGTAWSRGVMPSFMNNEETFATGWNLGGDTESSSKNTMIYYSNRNKGNIKVLLERDDNGIGCSMPTISGNNMYFMSFQAWKNKEALYSIRQCEIHRSNDGYALFNFRDVLSGGFCYARPVPFRDMLWCCYREYGKRNYKPMCLQRYHNTWLPIPIETEEEIVAYPYPFTLDKRDFILYNNDETLRGKIQVAEIIYE